MRFDIEFEVPCSPHTTLILLEVPGEGPQIYFTTHFFVLRHTVSVEYGLVLPRRPGSEYEGQALPPGTQGL